MKINTELLASKIQTLFAFIKRYVTFVFVLAMLVIFSFMVFRINQFSSTEPSEDAIAEKINITQNTKIDPKVIEKIQQLQSQNIEVQSLFDNARNNPFDE